MRLTIAIAGLSAAAICLLAAQSAALAQATLIQSSPAEDSTVSTPRTIKLTLSEKITPAFSGFKLSMADGMAVSTATSLSDDGKTLIGRPTSPFMAGKWTVSWHATSVDDAHKTEGSYIYTVK